jgi:hypothetical protein
MRVAFLLMPMIVVSSGGCAALHSTYDRHVHKTVNSATGSH